MNTTQWIRVGLISVAAYQAVGVPIVAMAQGGGVVQGVPSDATKPIVIEMEVPACTERGSGTDGSLRVSGRSVLKENAALHYFQALQSLGTLTREEAEEISALREANRLPADQDRAMELIVKHLQSAPVLLELASRCEQCEWQTPVDHLGVETLMPELGKFRAVARTLALRARLETSQGKHEEATRTLRIGITMARHIAEGPTLIQSLVGYAVMDLMMQELETSVRTPRASSMYWALMDLGTPVFDVGHALDSERRAIAQAFPEIDEIHSGRMIPQQALSAWKAFVTRYSGLTSAPRNEMKDAAAAFEAVSDSVAVYADACEYLRGLGSTAAEIEAMPVAYVSLRYLVSKQLTRHAAMFRWASVPYWQAMPGLAAVDEQFASDPVLERLAPLSEFMPALSHTLIAQVRTERRIALLRCVEAIRLYAGANDGSLPATLDATASIAPCPQDPATGKAFDYKVENGTAFLSGSTQPKLMSRIGFEYRVRIVGHR